MTTLLQPRHKLQTQQGLTLIEIMIAMTLSLLLLAGVVLIMRGSKNSYDNQYDASRIQENARYALELIAKDLRMTGYFGCQGSVPNGGNIVALGGDNNRPVNGTQAPFSDVIRVAYVDSNQGAFAIIHCPSYTPYRELLQSRGYTSETNYHNTCPQPTVNVSGFNNAVLATPFQNDTAKSSSRLNLDKLPAQAIVVQGDINTGDTVVVSDCGGSDAYTINYNDDDKSIALTALSNGTDGLLRTYNNNSQSYGAFLRPLRIWRYFVAPVTRDNRTYYTLCRDSNPLVAATTKCPEANELIEGVENMQIRYGVRNAVNNTIQYLNATTVNANAQWDSVVSVKITLLMQNVEERFNRDADTRTYVLDADTPNDNYDPPDDHRIRRIFSTTVMLRNWQLN